MLRIAICDDELLVAKALKKMVKKCLDQCDIICEIDLFESGKELLESDVLLYEMIFLDLAMPDMDGIEVGRVIRLKNRQCKIIITTGKRDRVKEVFCIQAFRFITKPFALYEIEEAVQAFQTEQLGYQKIDLWRNRQKHFIYQNEIKYIMAYDSYTEYICKNGDFRSEMSLTAVSAILDGRIFYRISRKYIVNILWIEKYKNYEIVIDGKGFLVSRRRKKAFEQIYMNREF